MGFLEGGNQVDQLGIVLDDLFFQQLGNHAVLIGLHRHEIRLIELEGLQCAQKVGLSTNIESPGSSSALQIKSSACWLPVTGSSCSGRTSTPL